MEQVFDVAEKDGKHHAITLKGRNAWALLELISEGQEGCTPIDNPAPRWSAYIHTLRHHHFLDIVTIAEPHRGPFPGHHARYVLRSVVSPIDGDFKAA